MQVAFIDAGGIKTRCLMAGRPGAYPVLLLHGYGGTADIWIRTIDALGSEFHVVAPDMLNSGFTDLVPVKGPPQGPTVAHLLKLAETLGWKTFCPVGTSFGGLIAALLYFAAPERVDKLILNGSGTCFNDDAALEATLRNMLKNFGPLMEAPTLEACRGTLLKQVFDPAKVPDEIVPVMATAYARPGMFEVWRDGVYALLDFEACKPYAVRDRLHELDVETLVVWGREDPGAIYEMAVAAMPRLPRAQLVTFEQCGHKPMLEYPERYNTMMGAFLRSGRKGLAA